MFRAAIIPLASAALIALAASTAHAASGADRARQQQESAQADSAKKEKKNKNLPLEPGRTVAIDTDEGTWISLDVSPDGKTLVFDLLGDLYLLPFDGGSARQLTRGMAWAIGSTPETSNRPSCSM